MQPFFSCFFNCFNALHGVGQELGNGHEFGDMERAAV